MNDHFEKMVAETKFVVEATDNEMQSFWEKFSTEAMHPRPEFNKYKWEQINPGYVETVGELAGFPVCISVFWFRINGVTVMFYDATSRVVDHQMIEEWLDKHCAPRWDKGTRLARCNSNNFHHVLNYVDREEDR